MKKVSLLFFLFACQCGSLSGQSFPKQIMNIDPDSSMVTISKVVTKEMTKPFQEPFEYELSRFSMTKRDRNVFLRKAAKKSFYQDSRALLTHSNVLFSFYEQGVAHCTVEFSTVTGNIHIINLLTEKGFHSSASKKFRRHLNELFGKYGVLEIIDPADLGAIEQN